MASIRITLKRRSKGGPGSGNWGHSGRQGLVGGSAPRSHSMSVRTGADWQKRYEAKTGRKPAGEATAKKDPDQERLENYFAAHGRIQKLKQEVDWARDDVKRAKKNLDDAWRRGYDQKTKDYYTARLNEADKKAYAAERTWNEAKKKMATDYKGIKAPAYGEWKRTEKPASKHVGGSSTTYHVPGRLELGEVSVYHFSGWSMQRVAPRSSITYNGNTFEWSGQSADQSARNFMNKVFGTNFY